MRTWNILPGITDTIYLNQKQETRNKPCLSLCNCSIMLPYNHVKVPACSHALALVLSEDQHLLAMVKVGISHPIPVWDWGQAESWGTGTTFSRSLSSSSNPTHSESEWKPSACSCNCRDLFRFSSISPSTEIKSDMRKQSSVLNVNAFPSTLPFQSSCFCNSPVKTTPLKILPCNPINNNNHSTNSYFCKLALIYFFGTCIWNNWKYSLG